MNHDAEVPDEIQPGDIVEHPSGLRAHVVDVSRDEVTVAYRCGTLAGRWARDEVVVVERKAE